MTLKAGDFYDCFAEKAEFWQGRSGALSIKMTYRFPKTGDSLVYYHVIVKADGTVTRFPVDRRNPDGPKTTELEVLEKRYGVDLSNADMEFDQTKLSKDIIVRALIEEETGEWEGQPFRRLRIRRIYPSNQGGGGGERGPTQPDKDALRRKFGSALRACHSGTRTPTVDKPNAPAPASKPAAPPAPPNASAAPQKNVKTSSLDECWQMLRSLPSFKDADEGVITEKWFELIQSTVGHVQQERITPEEWGRVMVKIEEMDEVPF